MGSSPRDACEHNFVLYVSKMGDEPSHKYTSAYSFRYVLDLDKLEVQKCIVLCR